MALPAEDPRDLPDGPPPRPAWLGPRVAPPRPLVTRADELAGTAAGLGRPLLAWQRAAAEWIEAVAPDGRHLYREVAIVAARQNGKTALVEDHIVRRLRQGRRIVHAAQNRMLPRAAFERVADALWESDRRLFPRRAGRPVRPRFANGQEEVRLANGGSYRIVAATRGGARGMSCDDLVVDELREMDGWDFMAAVRPVLSASPDPQALFLSNAGSHRSIVLNALRERSHGDPSLAWLEWSASPERAPGDRAGWAEANPAAWELPGLWESLESEHRAAEMTRTLAVWETEHLCRWVEAEGQRVCSQSDWLRCRCEVEPPRRSVLGVSVDPTGARASAVAAWRMRDGRVAIRLVADVTGEPVDQDALGPELRRKGAEAMASSAAFDPWTDGALAAHLLRAQAVQGRAFVAASVAFARLVETRRLAWDGADEVGDDLRRAARRPHPSGAWMAVRADGAPPITALLAAVRAVGCIAAAPAPAGEARVW